MRIIFGTLLYLDLKVGPRVSAALWLGEYRAVSSYRLVSGLASRQISRLETAELDFVEWPDREHHLS